MFYPNALRLSGYPAKNNPANMSLKSEPLDLLKLKVYPLAQRESLNSIDRTLVDPDQPARPCDAGVEQALQECARKVARASEANASVMLIYGAHLIKNGAMRVVNSLIE